MQTREGAAKAAKTNKERYGDNFYAEIGAKGGKLSTGGGFAKRVPCNCTLIYEPHHKAQCAGLKGGLKSKRGKSL